jgi:cytochrome c oxidase assembly protein subunit 15
MLMPPMVGGVFYEHGHRMAATTVGFLTLVLAVWTARTEPRPGVRRLAWGALAAVITQGILGGLTVIYLLPTPVSVTHACLAQLFFCATIALATVTSREWIDAQPADDVSGVRTAAAAAAVAVFAQLFLGAVMRHIGAGLAIPTFPDSFGRWVPPLDSVPVAVHFAHRIGALVVAVFVVRLAVAAHRADNRRFRRPAALLVALVALQVALGAMTVLTAKAVTPTTTHVAIGAAILGSCWWMALRSRRLLRAPGAVEARAVSYPEPAVS